MYYSVVQAFQSCRKKSYKEKKRFARVISRNNVLNIRQIDYRKIPSGRTI